MYSLKKVGILLTVYKFALPTPINCGGHFIIIGKKIPISDFQMKTIFDSKIQSFDGRRLIFWILGINEPIIHCVKNNRSHFISLKS